MDSITNKIDILIKLLTETGQDLDNNHEYNTQELLLEIIQSLYHIREEHMQADAKKLINLNQASTEEELIQARKKLKDITSEHEILKRDYAKMVKAGVHVDDVPIEKHGERYPIKCPTAKFKDSFYVEQNMIINKDTNDMFEIRFSSSKHPKPYISYTLLMEKEIAAKKKRKDK